MVGVVVPFGVFFLVVLKDAVLLPFLYVLPVCLKRYVEEGVTSEHQLCWRGSCCGVYYAADSLSDCAEDSFPFEVFVEIILSPDVSCAEHVCSIVYFPVGFQIVSVPICELIVYV